MKGGVRLDKRRILLSEKTVSSFFVIYLLNDKDTSKFKTPSILLV